MPWHLAQINVARLIAPMDDPAIADFAAALDPVNALADAAPGFVWRLEDEAGDATAIDLFGDPLVIVNFSVWESIDAFRDFTYGPGHREVLRRRREWFVRPSEPHLALWWTPAGRLPSTEEAVERLAHLRTNGPSACAFTLRETFPPPH